VSLKVVIFSLVKRFGVPKAPHGEPECTLVHEDRRTSTELMYIDVGYVDLASWSLLLV